MDGWMDGLKSQMKYWQTAVVWITVYSYISAVQLLEYNPPKSSCDIVVNIFLVLDFSLCENFLKTAYPPVLLCQ